MANQIILWQIHEGNLSGANICLLEYFDILIENKFFLHVIVPADGNMLSELRKRKITFYIIPSYSWSAKVGHFDSLIVKLRKAVRNFWAKHQSIKLIKTIDPKFTATNSIVNPVLAFAAKACNKQHFWFIHEFGEEDHGFLIAGNSEKGKKLINKYSDKLVFNSISLLVNFLPFIDKNKSIVIDNAVIIKAPKKKIVNSMGYLKLLMVGQIALSKNQLDAFKAVHYCLKMGVQLTLNILGKCNDDDYMNLLVKFIKHEKLQRNIIFLGNSDNPGEILVEHDVLLMCSRMEAFGRVTVEALKCGLPVIAANTGGSIEIIFDQKNGYLYKSGDYIDLASKIITFSKDKSKFDKAQIASDANQRYNKENTAKQLKELFK